MHQVFRHQMMLARTQDGMEGLDLARLLDAVSGAYAELEATNARLRDAVAHIGAGLAVWGADERLALCNDTLRRLLPQLSDILAPGLAYYDLLDAGVNRRVIALNRLGRDSWIETAVARHRKPSGNNELRLADGRILEIRKERTQDGGVVDLLTDVTHARQSERDLRHAKEQAVAANRAKSEFLANVSHELRTPLNAIIGFAEMMANQMLGPIGLPRYREYASDIRDSGGHLLSLINDILDMARIEAGRLHLHEEPVDLPAMLEACTKLVEQRARHGDVAVETAIQRPLPRLLADKRMVKQILLNLLSNAVKFTPRGGRVTVATWSDDAGRMTIQTSDTGIGMTIEEIGKALTPFHRSESALNRRFEGTGLGLPITKSLVDAHGAGFRIDSEPGVGTRCAVVFPAFRTLF